MNLLLAASPSLPIASLQWQGSFSTGLLWTVLIALAGFFIFQLLRQEQRLVSRRVGVALLLLRGSILLLLLLTLFRPAVISAYDRSRVSKLLIAVDASRSMQFQDHHASAEEKLRWARALRWVTADTELTVPSEPSEDNDNDDTITRNQEVQDENLTALFEQLTELSREEIVNRAIEQQNASFLERLQAKMEIERIRFAGEVATDEPPSSEPTDIENSEQTSGISTAETLDANETDFVNVERKALELSGVQPLAGIVLFTDGQHNQPGDPLEMAASLSQLNVPIYPVVAGSERRPADIVLQNVVAPPAVYLDDEATASVYIEAIELPGQEIVVELYHQGELLEQQSFVTSEEQSYSETLTFALETDKADQHHYEIRLLPNKDEFTTRNNQQHFTQQVLDNMIHALFIDHHPRWEFRFLHSALERDERIELQTILLNPPVLSPALDDDNQQTSLPFTDKITVVDEANQSLFAGQDLVILGDLSETTLREELTAEEFDLFWQQLGQFVSEEGKTLVLLPGEEMLSTWNGDAPVAKLSPLMNPQMIEPEEGNADPLPLGMPVLPTPIGYGTPFLQFGDQPEQNQQIWERLPGHFRAYTGEPKPAAEVVLNAFPSRDAAGQPAMAYQQFGQGQVVWLGLDSTWRWRRRVGDKYHHRFWGQMARWAIQNKLSVETELVRFGPERPEGIPNQPIRLHAHFSSTLLEQLPELNPQVAVFRLPHTPDEEPIFRLPLLSLPSRQQSMTAVVENLPEGDYEFVLETDQEELFPDEILAPYVVRPLPTLELTETTANRKLLEQLAAQTGGKLMELDQLDQIPDIIQPSAATETWQDETHLWTHPLWLTLFVTLLSSEWLIRKWNGLP